MIGNYKMLGVEELTDQPLIQIADVFIQRDLSQLTTKFTGRPRTILNSGPTSTAAPVQRFGTPGMAIDL